MKLMCIHELRKQMTFKLYGIQAILQFFLSLRIVHSHTYYPFFSVSSQFPPALITQLRIDERCVSLAAAVGYVTAGHTENLLWERSLM